MISKHAGRLSGQPLVRTSFASVSQPLAMLQATICAGAIASAPMGVGFMQEPFAARMVWRIFSVLPIAFTDRQLTIYQSHLHDVDQLRGPSEQRVFTSDLRLLGLNDLIDPTRGEAVAAVRDCQSAGIAPMMITGNPPVAALSITNALRIIAERRNQVVTGDGENDAPAYKKADFGAAGLRANNK